MKINDEKMEFTIYRDAQIWTKALKRYFPMLPFLSSFPFFFFLMFYSKYEKNDKPFFKWDIQSRLP